MKKVNSLFKNFDTMSFFVKITIKNNGYKSHF